MVALGRLFLLLGGLLLLAGICLLLAARWNLPLGRLPGDILWRGKNSTVYFPLGTSILLSLLFSLLLYLLHFLRR